MPLYPRPPSRTMAQPLRAANEMTDRLFDGRTRVAARAHLLGHRLALRELDPGGLAAAPPLVVPAGKAGCAVLFRYGAAVLFGLSPAEETEFLGDLRAHVDVPYPDPETEELELVAEPGAAERPGGGVLALRSFEVGRLQVVGDALAKSVVLAHYETQVAAVFDEIEPLAEGLRTGGRARTRNRDLLLHIGRSLDIQQRTVGRVEVEEKPEILWERPDLDRLHLRLREEYELRERHRALERKLELVSRTAGTLLTLQHNRRSLRVEWYIVALILFEILIYLWDLFVRA